MKSMSWLHDKYAKSLFKWLKVIYDRMDGFDVELKKLREEVDELKSKKT